MQPPRTPGEEAGEPVRDPGEGRRAEGAPSARPATPTTRMSDGRGTGLPSSPPTRSQPSQWASRSGPSTGKRRSRGAVSVRTGPSATLDGPACGRVDVQAVTSAAAPAAGAARRDITCVSSRPTAPPVAGLSGMAQRPSPVPGGGG